MEEYFFYLDNMLEDDKKIITLKAFAMKFNIHVNKAINILDEYAKNQFKLNKKLSITYCICGDIISEKNEKFFQVEIVSDENLKKTLSKYLSGCTHHIYSIQPCPLHSFTMLYNVDIDINKMPSKSGAINLPNVEFRKFPLCKVPTETLQKLSILTDKKKQINSDTIIQDKKNGEFKKDNSSKLGEDYKTKLNSNISNKNANNMHSFFGKKLNEKSTNLEVNRSVQEKKVETILSNQCKPSTSKVKTNEKENKLKQVFTQVKKSADVIKPFNLKRKCNISSSEDEDSLSSKEDLNEEHQVNSILLFDSPSKKNSDEENIKTNILESPKDALKYHNEDNILKNKEKDFVDNNSSGVTRKKTLVRKTFLDNNGFMVTEKVWESAIINLDSDLLKESPKKSTSNGIAILDVHKIVDTDVTNVVDKNVVDKVGGKCVKGNKVCTKPRQKIAPLNKQSMLTNFFKKN